MPWPEIQTEFAYGAPGTTPALKAILKTWRAIIAAVDPWLDTLTSAKLRQFVVQDGKKTNRMYGNLLQRVIYHYWYHTGENAAVRQALGHEHLPVFVGNIDGEAPYRPDVQTARPIRRSPRR